MEICENIQKYTKLNGNIQKYTEIYGNIKNNREIYEIYGNMGKYTELYDSSVVCPSIKTWQTRWMLCNGSGPSQTQVLSDPEVTSDISGHTCQIPQKTPIQAIIGHLSGLENKCSTK